jgi:hypothetical protein
MKAFSIGQGWHYSTVHNSACKVIEEQTGFRTEVKVLRTER